MNTDTSRPAGWPTMASPAFPRALLLRMYCRSDPWPESFTLTIVSKLKPKSMPETPGVPTAALVMDCAVPEMPAVNTPVAVFIVVPALPLPASATAGFWPPT